MSQYAYYGIKTPKGIHIGNNVSVGSGPSIVVSAAIGDGVIIAPNSVVSGKISENVSGDEIQPEYYS